MTASEQLTGHRQQPVSANFTSRLINVDAGHPTQLDIRKQKDLRVQLWEMLSEINCWRDKNVRSNQCVLRWEGSPFFIHPWIIFLHICYGSNPVPDSWKAYTISTLYSVMLTVWRVCENILYKNVSLWRMLKWSEGLSRKQNKSKLQEQDNQGCPHQ